MTYSSSMIIFIESPLFTKQVHDYLSNQEYAFQAFLAASPDAGDMVKGAGGIRKIRWKRQGGGKSGGVRIMYYARLQSGEIWLLLIYAKSVVDSIPGHILKALKEEIDHDVK